MKTVIIIIICIPVLIYGFHWFSAIHDNMELEAKMTEILSGPTMAASRINAELMMKVRAMGLPIKDGDIDVYLSKEENKIYVKYRRNFSMGPIKYGWDMVANVKVKTPDTLERVVSPL